MREVTTVLGQTISHRGEEPRVVDEMRLEIDGELPDRIHVLGGGGGYAEGTYQLIENGDVEDHEPERFIDCRTEYRSIDHVTGTGRFWCPNYRTLYGMLWEPAFCPICGGRTRIVDKREEPGCNRSA